MTATAITATQNPFETVLPTETLLVRPENSGRPFLYFKARGSETVWNLTLERMFGTQGGPAYSHQTLLAIGPLLLEAAEEAAVHLHHREKRTPTDVSGTWSHRIYRTPTSALKAIRARLLDLSRKYIALDLVQRFFPDKLEQIKFDDDWVTAFQRFLKYVQDEDWFPIDWATLDIAYHELMAQDAEDSDEWLAEFLITIPLPAIAPVEDALEEPHTLVLYGLFVNAWILSNELRTYGIDEPQTLDNEMIYNRIRALEAELADLEYPLNFLPGIARLYRRETGFEILDTPGIEGVSTPWGATGEFTWEHDVNRVRMQWHGAAPLVDQFNAFQEWIKQDERNFDRAVSLILQAGGVI